MSGTTARPATPVSTPVGPGEIEGVHYRTGERVRVRWRSGTIDEIEPLGGDRAGDGPRIGPGLVDLQVNGYRGIDLNSQLLTVEQLESMTVELRRDGVTSFLPTIVSNTELATLTAVATVARAWTESPTVRAGVVGIHLEGPFISPDDGPRGAHSPQHVRPPDWSLFQRWQDAAEGLIRIVTVSPEWPGSCDFIARCVEQRVVVAIGHTAASPEQIRDAVAAGARLSTHLGNGTHAKLPRHPNYLWEQLAADDLWASVIADGFHLPDAVLKVIVKVKEPRVLVVSDAVSLVGMPPGEYETTIGGSVVLTKGGKLHVRENDGLLAGSARTLPEALSHLASRRLVPFATAWDMCSSRPSLCLGLPTAPGLAVGAPADLVLLEQDDDRIRVLRVLKSGTVAFDASAAR